MNFSIENAVIKFIKNKQKYLIGEKNKNVTILGASKGGFSALYFGLKYNFLNIISSAPQHSIGTFLYKKHLKEFLFMTKNKNDIKELDNLIDNISKKSNIDKNIYLISSKVDQYETCEKLHNLLKKFNNFNHIITNSCLVSEHNMITSYNIPIILSILYANSQNANPKFNEYIYNGIPKYKYNDIVNNELYIDNKYLITELEKCNFNENKFYPEGIAFIKGIPSPKYGIFRKKIIFKSMKVLKKYKIGSTEKRYVTKKYFDNYFIDYTTSGFATIHNEGIYLDLENGKYDIYIQVNNDEYNIIEKLKYTGNNIINLNENKIYLLYSKNNFAILNVFDSLSLYKPDECIVYNKWYKDSKIHYEGIMLRYGFEAENYRDINFYIVLKNNNIMYTFKYAKNNIEDLNLSLMVLVFIVNVLLVLIKKEG